MREKILVLFAGLLVMAYVNAQSKFSVNKFSKAKKEALLKQKELLRINSGTKEKYAYPIWSPDGTKIAFSNEASDVIYIYDLKSKNKKTLIRETGAGYKFTWSNDGRFIAYRGTKGTGKDRLQFIAYVETNSGKVVKVSENKSYLQPPWWHYENNKLYLAYLDEAEIKKCLIASIQSNNAIEKNNTHAVFMNDKLYLTDGYNLKVISENISFDPVFSPDRTKMFYSSMDGLYLWDISRNTTEKFGEQRCPSFSPDGRFIVYQVAKDDGNSITEADIMLYSFDTTDQIALTKTKDEFEDNPSFSPCGKRICYNTIKKGEIIIVELKN